MSEENEDAGTQIESYVAPPPEARSVAPRLPDEEFRGSSAIVVPQGSAQAQSMSVGAVAQLRLQTEMAMLYPRDEIAVMTTVYNDCQDLEFAMKALYSFPRGKDRITGPSIVLAEQMGRRWGNLKWGFAIIDDQKATRTIRAYAWDLQTNTVKESDRTFAKLVERRVEGGVNQWVVPDERGLYELTNRNASKAIRNAILGMLPDRLKRDAQSWCRQRVQASDAKRSPEHVRKTFALEFAKLGVTPKMIEDFLGRPIDQANANDLDLLRGIGNRIKTGESTWHDILAEKAESGGGAPPPPRNNEEVRRQASAQANKKRGDG